MDRKRLKQFFIGNKYKLITSLLITIISWLMFSPYITKCERVYGDVIYIFCENIIGKVLGIFVVVDFAGILISTFISELLYIVFSFYLPNWIIWIFSFVFSFVLYYLLISFLWFIVNEIKNKKQKGTKSKIKSSKKLVRS